MATEGRSASLLTVFLPKRSPPLRTKIARAKMPARLLIYRFASCVETAAPVMTMAMAKRTKPAMMMAVASFMASPVVHKFASCAPAMRMFAGS